MDTGGRKRTADKQKVVSALQEDTRSKKNLVLLGAINENNLEAAEPLIKTLDPTGFYISVNCSCKEKAEDVLEKITLWSK